MIPVFFVVQVRQDPGTDEWMHEQDGPDYDRILGQTTGLLAQRGDEHAVALLVDVQFMTLVETDELIRTERYAEPWTGEQMSRSIYRRRALLNVEEHLVARFTDDVCERISKTLTYVAERNGEENVAYVQARPALPGIDDDWRATFTAHLTLERPTNQARQEIGRANHPVEDGLTFGSAEELRVYQALKRLQIRFPEQDTIAIALYRFITHRWCLICGFDLQAPCGQDRGLCRFVCCI